MRQLIYLPEHAGLTDWPPGTLRLEGIEETKDPAQADVFVVPGNIRIFEKSSGVLDMAKLNLLPYFRGNESRHVFMDVSDNFTQAVNLPIIFIKSDARTWMLPRDPNTISMSWPVDDLAECVDLPGGKFRFDVSFHGWNSGLARKVSATSCKNNPALASDIAIYSDFYGHLGVPDGKKSEAQIERELEEKERRRSEFLRSLRESRMILCPESIPGVLPYRFFEALSAGRYPILVGRNYVLPFADEIPYDEFMARIDVDQADEAGAIVAEIRSRHTDAVFIEKGLMARKYWLKFMDSRRWPELHAYAVKKHLAVTV